MIVADTSALISMATIDKLESFITEFDVHTTETVVQELEAINGYDDQHGDAAEMILMNLDRMSVHRQSGDLRSSRVDQGEGSCALLTNDLEADFLITDDLRSLPELQAVVDARVAISPIVLRALVKRGELDPEEAKRRLTLLAESRDWLGAPIYRRAQALFADL
jgi:rRNA-processing protein FCF1